MKDKMIRVTDEVVGKLKTLKGIIGSTPYSDTIDELLHEKLLTLTAFTEEGYVPVGAVVMDTEGNTLVIRSIVNDKVIFNDHSHMFNGGGDCMKLVKLSDTVEEFKS